MSVIRWMLVFPGALVAGLVASELFGGPALDEEIGFSDGTVAFLIVPALSGFGFGIAFVMAGYGIAPAKSVKTAITVTATALALGLLLTVSNLFALINTANSYDDWKFSIEYHGGDFLSGVTVMIGACVGFLACEQVFGSKGGRPL